eukprot:6073727-Prymnesium_polylepis.2
MAGVWGLHGRLLTPRERTASSRAPVGGEEAEAPRGFSRQHRPHADRTSTARRPHAAARTRSAHNL